MLVLHLKKSCKETPANICNAGQLRPPCRPLSNIGLYLLIYFYLRSDGEDLSKKEKPVFISNNVKCILLGILEPSLALTSGQGSL